MMPIYGKHYYSPTVITSVYLTELGDRIEEGFLVTILIKNRRISIILVVLLLIDETRAREFISNSSSKLKYILLLLGW